MISMCSNHCEIIKKFTQKLMFLLLIYRFIYGSIHIIISKCLCWLLACYFLTWFAPVTCTRLLSWQGVQTKWQLQGGVWAVHHGRCDGGGVWCHNPRTEIPEERERGNLSPERYWTMSSKVVLYSWNYNSCFTHEL